MPFEKGTSGNLKGRGNAKEIDPTPAELKRMMKLLRGVSPKAVELLIEAMVKTMPDGSVLKDTKIAEKLIDIYFKSMRASEEIKQANKGAEKVVDKPEDNRPKFSLEVVNPTTGKIVGIKAK
jgi:hypothetical protein